MSNREIRQEAIRISKELIEIEKSDRSLDAIFHSLLKKEFESDDMKVLLYISEALIDEKYALESCNPFRLKKIRI